MPLNIYNEYFGSEEATEEKSAWGQLKRWKIESCVPDSDLKFHYAPDIDDKTIFFLNLDSVSKLERGHMNFIARQLARVDGYSHSSKVVIDTTLEDFVGANYFELLHQMAMRGIPRDRIIILTSQTHTQNFADEFYSNFKILHYDMFASAYHNFATDKQLFREVKPRELTKHFILYMKRPRMLRMIANGFFQHREYIDKCYYSWHYSDQTIINQKLNLHFETNIKRLVDWEDLWNKDYYAENIFDEIDGSKEWIMSPKVVDSGGINLPMETHRRLDSDVFFTQNLDVLDNCFFTEKTYKNFVYGLPFIGFGIPNYENYLNKLGYMSWESMFDTKINNNSYPECMLSYFELVDEIANMPLSKLQDLLNSEESLDRARNNQKVFNERNEIKKLITELKELWD